MPQIKWSRFALEDLARLRDFLTPHSDEASQRAIRVIRAGVKQSVSHPKIGKLVEGLPEEFREWIIPFGQSAYVVLYQFEDSDIVILAVRHGREAGY